MNDLFHQFASLWLHSNFSPGWVKLMNGSATRESEPLPDIGIILLHDTIMSAQRKGVWREQEHGPCGKPEGKPV